MRSPCWLHVCVPLKSGMVEPIEMAVARLRLGKHFPVAKNKHATVGRAVLHAISSSVMYNCPYLDAVWVPVHSCNKCGASSETPTPPLVEEDTRFPNT
jgi:hypothetical protein